MLVLNFTIFISLQIFQCVYIYFILQYILLLFNIYIIAVLYVSIYSYRFNFKLTWVFPSFVLFSFVFFRPLMKSPIPLNRYDGFVEETSVTSATSQRDRTPEPKIVARGLYNFVAQNSRFTIISFIQHLNV